MATIVTVHGTFAHVPLPGNHGDQPANGPQWWEPESEFIADLKSRLSGDATDSDTIKIEPFVWSGNNSESERRAASRELLSLLKRLEAGGETYSVIGHSHGGSVISSALLLAAYQKQQLPGLKKWVTVGTPFVELRKERLLFLRLPIVLKALFVASLMLLFMFIFSQIGDWIAPAADPVANEARTNRQFGWARFLISAVLTTLPFIVFITIAMLHDRRELFHYRKRVRTRARDWFAARWLPLTHEDDEAVSGLSSLERVKLKVFSPDFAVPALSVLSVFILPIAYLWALTSPGLMVSITDYLKTEVYKIEQFESAEKGYEERMRSLRGIRRQLRQLDQEASAPDVSVSKKLDIDAERQKLAEQRTSARKELRELFPEFEGLSRAMRFKRRFLERKGQECDGGQLCGKGSDVWLNSKLLFHLVTDEASAWVLDPEVRPSGTVGRIIGAIIPVLLVPIVFAAFAVMLVYLVQWLASVLSRAISRWLDRATIWEINRSALGNDTETEVALRAAPRPAWVDASRPLLPRELSERITARSNEAAVISIAKFREALSDFALSDLSAQNSHSFLGYLNWNELVHTVYFDVDGFRAIVAAALVDGGGFKPRPGLEANHLQAPDQLRALEWLQALMQEKERTSENA